MNPIRQLDAHLINKIAAGEVVERPLSVVKELTENAIDAGASVITVEIRDGGLTQIRVTDNGGGIEAEQVPLAFARHATSKIAEADDLFAITTLGFRGEALASIAEVSQTEMVTKTAGAVYGTRMEIHGGKEVSLSAVGCADGTTVVVSNLFYNTPARRKFLKKPAVEAGYISDIMQKLAIGNPGLTFRFITDGRLALQTNGNGDLKTAVHYVFGREISARLLRVSAAEGSALAEAGDAGHVAVPSENEIEHIKSLSSKGNMKIDGYLGKPEIARGNRQYGLFYLNGRVIQSRLLRKAVEDAMKTALFNGKFPVYVLRLEIDPADVDVNVHPAKTEVRFGDEERVYQFVQEAVKNALYGGSLIPEVSFNRKTGKTAEGYGDYEEQQMPAEYERIAAPEARPSAPSAPPPSVSQPVYEAPPAAPYPPPLSFSQPDSAPSSLREEYPPPPALKRFFTDFAVLGLLFKTYWLVAQGESLYLIDQHAAHERVLYEKILRDFRSASIHSQPLLEPLGLRLTPRETQTLRGHRDLFEKFGFDVSCDEASGKAEVSAVPFIFKGPLPPVFFTEILDRLDNMPVSGGSLHEHKAEYVAMAACKAAVKANDRLSEAEARALVEQMLLLENPFTCPHGRPTIIEITKRELERKFKRVT